MQKNADGAALADRETLEGQHRSIHRRIRALVAEVEARPESDAILAQLEALLREFEGHFAAESELMRAHAYPRLQSHEQAHSRFRGSIVEMCDFVRESGSEILGALVKLLEHWLDKHEGNEDKLLFEFLKWTGPGSTARDANSAS